MQDSLPRRLGRKTTLYISHRAGEIFLRGKNIVLGGKPDMELPLCGIRRVVLLGRANLDMAVVYRLVRAGIPIDWLDPFGKPLGQLLPVNAAMDSHLAAQGAFAASPEALELARELLLAKLDNSREVVRRWPGVSEAWHESWHDMRAGMARAANGEALRGAEGYAARMYFSLWKDTLEPFEWMGRQAHPAPDPVNMLLSLGYSLVYNRLSSALRHAGLNPRIGFFHVDRGSHNALTSDLMEPYRCHVDRTVLRLVHRKEISPGQFTLKGDRCICAENNLFAFLLQTFEEMFADMHRFYISPEDPDAFEECSLNDSLDNLAASFTSHISMGSPCLIPRLARCPAI